jgi:hypothetical protein
MNVYVWPSINTNCKYDTTWLNAVFLYGVLLPEAILRVTSLAFWRSASYLTVRRVWIEVTPPCLYAIWLLVTLWYYTDFTPACYEPYPSYGLLVFTVVLCLVIPSAFFVLCMMSLLIVFSPCIGYQIFKGYMNQRQREKMKTQVIEALSKVTYSQIKIGDSSECAICLGNFEEDACVTPLGCDIRHYFHYECIKQWMREKNECPLCKMEIGVNNLKDL